MHRQRTGAGIYPAAKFAVRELAESLRYGLAPKGVNESHVCPGLVNSNINNSEDIGPRARADSGYAENREFSERLAEMQKMGMDPAEIGQKILRGILNGDLYILTHLDYQEEVVCDFEELLEAFPDEPGDPRRIEFERFRQKTKYDIKEEFASRNND